MKRSRNIRHLLLSISIGLLFTAVAIAPLTSLPHEVADTWNRAWARLLPSVSAASSAEQEVQAAWQRAQQAGAYDYTTEIVQTTYPAPALVNVGRSSREDRLYLEGEVNLPERTMFLTLWQGGSVLNPRDGVEVRVEGDRAYGRQVGAPWQEISDFSDAFAPGNDLMAYLAGAKNVRELGTETRSLPSPAAPLPTRERGDAPSPQGGEGWGEGGITFTRYAFDVDGPSFARHVRDQLERQLREKGELPLGLTLDVPRQYEAISGGGELWVDSRGLPLRLVVHLDYPEQANGERVEADIKTDFGFRNTDFGLIASSENDQSAIRLGLSHQRHDWGRAAQKAGLVATMLGLMALILVRRESKRVYAALAVSLICSMVLTPLLQSERVHAFYERQTARQAEQDQARQEEQAAREWQEQLTISDWDPHRDPLAVSDQLPVISDQSSVSNIQPPTSNLQPPAISRQQALRHPDHHRRAGRRRRRWPDQPPGIPSGHRAL
jgi:hypothetical protein